MESASTIKRPGLWAECINDVNPWPSEKCDELTIGEIYKVDEINMCSSYTVVYLAGSDKKYNSVQFKFYLNDKVHDIFKDSKYNPYL